MGARRPRRERSDETRGRGTASKPAIAPLTTCAVLDPNVLLVALLSPRGAAGRVLRAWLDGALELVISAAPLGELERALAYPKLRRRIPDKDAQALIELLARTANPRRRSPGGVTRFLTGPRRRLPARPRLPRESRLVSGDSDIVSMKTDLPIDSPSDFIERIEQA